VAASELIDRKVGIADFKLTNELTNCIHFPRVN
jgi:hypothetical protein